MCDGLTMCHSPGKSADHLDSSGSPSEETDPCRGHACDARYFGTENDEGFESDGLRRRFARRGHAIPPAAARQPQSKPGSGTWNRSQAVREAVQALVKRK